MAEDSGSMTVKEAGRKGGKKTAAQHGPDFYSKIGKKGGEARKQKLGKNGYRDLGRKGGQTTAKRQGAEFYSFIGRKGGKARTEKDTTDE